MRSRNWMRMGWWLFLVTGLGCFLYAQREAILAGRSSAFEIVAFLLLLALLVVPLFQEVTLFGIQLRRQMDELRSDVRREILDLRTEIRNTIDFRASVGHQIVLPGLLPAPPSDAQIEEMKDTVRRVLEDTLPSYGVRERVGEEEIADVPEGAHHLFGVRYNLEGQLRRIWQNTRSVAEAKRPLSVVRIVNTLVHEEVLDRDLAFVIRAVYSVCSAAVHGQEVTAEQREFVANTAPELIASLRAIDWTIELVPFGKRG